MSDFECNITSCALGPGRLLSDGESARLAGGLGTESLYDIRYIQVSLKLNDADSAQPEADTTVQLPVLTARLPPEVSQAH